MLLSYNYGDMKDDNILDTRLVNFRLPFVIFIGIVVGVLLSYNFFSINYLQKSILPTILVLIFIVIMFFVCLVCYCLRDRLNIIFCKRMANGFKVICWFSFSLLVGVLLSYINFSKFKINQVGQTDTVIVATVDNIIEYDYGVTLYLDKIEIVSNDSKNVSTKATMYVSKYCYNNTVAIGDTIKFRGNLIRNEIFDDNDIASLLNNYGYTIEFIEDENIEIVSNNYSFRHGILKYIKDILYNNLSSDNAGLAYSSLFGDKSVLPKEVNSIFSTAGVLHLLAVSGLHIGLISSLVVFVVGKICRICRSKVLIREAVTISFTAIFLLFYAYICGFATSVCRASIMVLVYLLSKSLGKKYDSLSSLGVAGTIILIFSPLSLLTVGFQLSFLCIFALITLVPKIQKLIDKTKIPQTITSPFVISLCINIIIAPVLINNFGELSLISVIANIIVIPFFSLMFPLLFTSMFLTAVIPSFGFILALSDIFIQILKFIIELFANVPFAVIQCFEVGYIVLDIILLIAFLSKYLMCNKSIKIIINTCLLVGFIVISIVNLLPTTYANSTIILESKYSEINMVLVEDDKTILFDMSDSLAGLLQESKINKVDILVLKNFEIKDLSKLRSMVSKFDIEEIYLSSKLESLNKFVVFDNCKTLYYDTSIEIGNCCVNIIKDYENNDLATYIKSDNYKILKLNKLAGLENLSFISSLVVDNIDYIITENADYDLSNYFDSYDKIITNQESILDNVVNLDKVKNYKLSFSKEG